MSRGDAACTQEPRDLDGGTEHTPADANRRKLARSHQATHPTTSPSPAQQTHESMTSDRRRAVWPSPRSTAAEDLLRGRSAPSSLRAPYSMSSATFTCAMAVRGSQRHVREASGRNSDRPVDPHRWDQPHLRALRSVGKEMRSRTAASATVSHSSLKTRRFISSSPRTTKNPRGAHARLQASLPSGANCLTRLFGAAYDQKPPSYLDGHPTRAGQLSSTVSYCQEFTRMNQIFRCTPPR